jgi:NADH:ubiquinone oxidoreductase subunit F (NADH-binding)
MDYRQMRARAESERSSFEGEKDLPDSSKTVAHALEKRIALRNCGNIAPGSISDYVLRGDGYSGLSRALDKKPADVIQELRESGLRGRGGGSFPVAEKWRICRDTDADEKYIVCDTVDADPKACTAKLLLENDPHAVLEGVMLGAYAAGARYGFICVNAGNSTAIGRLDTVLKQMREYNLLGDNILDSDFSCDIEIKEIPSSLVAGEETALIRFLEGRQMMPYMRPPYPAVSGLQGKPTLINNVETFANVSAVFQNGAAWYTDIGTERSRGTKIITLTGSVVNRCVVEVPFGATLREIVGDIGGGVINGNGIKAVRVGGPTGLFFSEEQLDIPVDFDTIAEAGGIVGSGTIEVFESNTCAVEMARDAVAYLQAESCGKCVFCREGSYQMADILNDICGNQGKAGDIDLLNEIARGMKEGSICGLGRTAPNPVLSSLGLFRGDYDAHISGKGCPVKNGS